MSQVDGRVLPVPITAGEFTFAQLYGKDVDKPLLRLVWKEYRYGIRNHLWAVFRHYHQEGDSLSAEWVDLGELGGFLHLTVRLRDGVLLVQANGHSVSRNAGRWKGRLYFKAGVYIQGDGCAKTYFDQLHITFWTTDG